VLLSKVLCPEARAVLSVAGWAGKRGAVGEDGEVGKYRHVPHLGRRIQFTSKRVSETRKGSSRRRRSGWVRKEGGERTVKYEPGPTPLLLLVAALVSGCF